VAVLTREFLAVVVAGIGIATHPALGGAPDALLLRPSDLPPNATRVSSRSGPAAAVASVLVGPHVRTLLRGSRHDQAAYRMPGREVVSSAFVFASAGRAKLVFAEVSRSVPRLYHRLTVGRLGDAQVTTFIRADAIEHRFIVRRGAVMWQLDVLDWSAAPRSKLTASALTLARKQRSLVG
jgi:hypothetical protein